MRNSDCGTRNNKVALWALAAALVLLAGRLPASGGDASAKSGQGEGQELGPFIHPWGFVEVDLDKTNNEGPEPFYGANREFYVTAQALRSNPSVQGVVLKMRNRGDQKNAAILTSALKAPRGMTTDGAFLYVVDAGADSVVRVDKDGNTALVAGGIKDPRYMTMDNQGNLYVSAAKSAKGGNSKGGGNQNQGVVYKITRGGDLPWGVSVAAEGFHDPRGVSWRDGALYIADSLGDNGKVVKIASDGTRSLVAEGFHRVEGIDLDACGNVYVAHGKEGDGKVEVVFPDGYRSVFMEGLGLVKNYSAYYERGEGLVGSVIDSQIGKVESRFADRHESRDMYARGIIGWNFFPEGVEQFKVYKSDTSEGPWHEVHSQSAWEERITTPADDGTYPIITVQNTDDRTNTSWASVYSDTKVKEVFVTVRAFDAEGNVLQEAAPLRINRRTCDREKSPPFVEGEEAEASQTDLPPNENLAPETTAAVKTSASSGTGIPSWPCGASTQRRKSRNSRLSRRKFRRRTT